jgi:hypothetical protein
MTEAQFLKNVWITMHVIGICYDNNIYNEDTTVDILNFFDFLKHLLPNKEAKNTFTNFLLQKPLNNYLNKKQMWKNSDYFTIKKDGLFYWTWALHHYVNLIKSRKGIPVNSLTFDQAYTIYAERVFSDEINNTFTGLPNSSGKYFWGPAFWTTLHYISANLPASLNLRDPQHNEFIKYNLNSTPLIFKNFVLSYQTLLPCKECRQHLSENISKLNFNAYLQKGLSDNIQFWIYIYTSDLHNIVNKMLNKNLEHTFKNPVQGGSFYLYNIQNKNYDFI